MTCQVVSDNQEQGKIQVSTQVGGSVRGLTEQGKGGPASSKFVTMLAFPVKLTSRRSNGEQRKLCQVPCILKTE